MDPNEQKNTQMAANKDERIEAELELSDRICDAMQEAEKNLSYIQILGIIENAKGCYMYLRMSKGESK